MAVLEVEHLEKSFGSLKVLRDISFSLAQGQALSIIGASGSGKTTLLRCLNFLEHPDGGTIRVRGDVLFDAKVPFTQDERVIREKRLHFGLVFQEFHLFPQYTALQNVTLARELLSKERMKRLKSAEKTQNISGGKKSVRTVSPETSAETGHRDTFEETGRPETLETTGHQETLEDTGRPETLETTGHQETLEDTGRPETLEEIKAAGMELLAQMGLADRAGYYPHQLSGGQKQRVAIARALALHPDILCFDEPTSALDPELTGEVLRVIRNLAERRTTMIIITHEMAFARDVADQVIFMDGGCIVEQGTPSQVMEHPREERTRRFLSRFAKN